MQILSHRGYWLSKTEQNSRESFIKSLENGFGIETDLRDHEGDVVISHDPAKGEEITFNEFLKIYNRYNSNSYLALNIKSDGLHSKISESIKKHHITNYFLFDMSIPDNLQCLANNLKYFTRQSEYEKEPCLYEKSDGVWLDEFQEHWITEEVIMQHIDNKKKIAIVSPELHGRTYEKEWQFYKKIMEKNKIQDSVMLCTDFPHKFYSLITQ